MVVEGHALVAYADVWLSPCSLENHDCNVAAQDCRSPVFRMSGVLLPEYGKAYRR